MKKAVIFDLNKTLRKESGEPRHHLVKKAKKDAKKEEVIVMSGETDKDRSSAKKWLDKEGLSEAKLMMRPKGDVSHDEMEKERLLTKKVSRQFKVEEAYDDQKKNVKMFKKHGIKAKKV
jgi:hypothetical protein